MKNLQEKVNIIEFVGFAHSCLTGGASDFILHLESKINEIADARGIKETEKLIENVLNDTNSTPLIKIMCRSFIQRYERNKRNNS